MSRRGENGRLCLPLPTLSRQSTMEWGPLPPLLKSSPTLLGVAGLNHTSDAWSGSLCTVFPFCFLMHPRQISQTRSLWYNMPSMDVELARRHSRGDRPHLARSFSLEEYSPRKCGLPLLPGPNSLRAETPRLSLRCSGVQLFQISIRLSP